MNIKKRLNQEAQNTYKEILTPQDNEFLAQLKQQTQANATKRPNIGFGPLLVLRYVL